MIPVRCGFPLVFTVIGFVSGFVFPPPMVMLVLATTATAAHPASRNLVRGAGVDVPTLGLAAAWFFAGLFFLRLEGYSRLVVVGAIALATCLVLLERRVLAALIRALQLSGRLGRRALIYGCGETGRLVLKKIVQAPHLGCAVVGFVDDEADEGGSQVPTTRTIVFDMNCSGMSSAQA